MNCPECRVEMQPGVIWLGTMGSAAKVLFSPSRAVSWIRRRLTGTIFYSGPQEGEVEILSREWTDKVSHRSGYYCRQCGIVVCHVDSRGDNATPDLTISQSHKQGTSMENREPQCNTLPANESRSAV
jgi:hypothetical protein